MRQRSSLFDLTSSSVVKELDVVAARTSVDSNYIEIEASSSISISLTHQRYMCQSKHYLFTIERHVPIRNEDNMKQPTTLYLLQFKLFHSLIQPLASSTILAACKIKMQFSSSTTNLPDLHNNLQSPSMLLVALVLPQHQTCNLLKPLFYNGKRKIDTNFHTKHFGIND